ncbi:MAG: MBL fold metallo-hydrolase [Bacteroidales bacterium]|nr:MBL fold metallo-hydrolase [Bacteroidales bacterium]
MIEFCSLASGSNGNCYYIGNETDAVLVDGGISNRRFVERAETAGVDRSKIRAIFVSHEHFDHIQGVKVIAKHLGVPVYFTYATFNEISKRRRPSDVRYFEGNIAVEVSPSITVRPFKKHHDAIDPCSFVVSISGHNVGVITDIGVADKECEQMFSLCDAVFLEMNYDPVMLQYGSYPQYLKIRIDSEKGHLSNYQAVELLNKHASPQLTHIIASHISAENNSQTMVEDMLHPFYKRYTIELAPRFAAGKRFTK